jgi:N-acetylmuramoyl-L-alanine amidase
VSLGAGGIWYPSPNFGPRRHGLPPDMVVIHYTAMESCAAALTRLCDPQAGVSAHYVISEAGQLYALVRESERAWHAGAGQWGSVSDVNSHSVGIELANAGPLQQWPQFPDAQMQALEDLLAGMFARWEIPPDRVIGHSDMAPGRKLDPGPNFDWPRLAARGLSVWAEAAASDPVNRRNFRHHARIFGYRAHRDDSDGWRQVLQAFRLRFRPGATGELSAADLGLITRLAQDYPCRDVDLGAAQA